MGVLSRFFQAVESHWSLYGMILRWVATIGSGAMSAWAARATDAFAAYAPFSWVAAGLLGALVIASIFALASWFRAQLQKASYLKEASKNTGSINPLEGSFTRIRIKVSDLPAPGFRFVEGKTFVDCEMVGPEAVILTGCNFDGFRGRDCDLLVIKDETPTPMNIVVFSRCHFVRCTFVQLVLMMSLNTAKDLHALAGGTARWLTHTSPEN